MTVPFKMTEPLNTRNAPTAPAGRIMADLEAERDACHALMIACDGRGEGLRANAWLSVGVAIAHLTQAHKAGNVPACLAGIKRRSFIFDLLFSENADSKPALAGQKKALLGLMTGVKGGGK